MMGLLRALRQSVSPGRRPWWRRYRRETRRPAHCLLFLLPLAAIYEIGALSVAGGEADGRDLLVPQSIREVLGWFGFLGSWVPWVMLVVALLVWHRLSRDRWTVRGWVFPGMVLESLVLTVPLLILSALFPQRGEVVAAGVPAQLVKALGAGVYEELVFRLLLISGLTWLLVEVARLRGTSALWAAAALASLVFARCHFQPIGWEPLRWGAFWFRAVAGVYLAILFIGRGLGVSAGCHAAYNMLLVWLRSGAG